MVGDLVLQSVGLGSLLVLALVYFFQGRLLYYPSMPLEDWADLSGKRSSVLLNPQGLRNPGEVGLPYEDVWLRTSDGVLIHGWFIKNPRSSQVPSMLYFHGNAGSNQDPRASHLIRLDIGHRMQQLLELAELPLNIFIVDYRGYGNSAGAPSEPGLTLDAQGALDYLRNRDDVDPSKIVVFGRSLGAAVALKLCHYRSQYIAAAIIENTFTSIDDMAPLILQKLGIPKSRLLSTVLYFFLTK